MGLRGSIEAAAPEIPAAYHRPNRSCGRLDDDCGAFDLRFLRQNDLQLPIFLFRVLEPEEEDGLDVPADAEDDGKSIEVKETDTPDDLLSQFEELLG